MYTTERPPSGEAHSGGNDPRLIWSGPDPARDPHRPPVLRHRRDGILPASAAALSVRGSTYTHASSRCDEPPRLHPIVADFLDALPITQRERFVGRCPEAVLLSQYLASVDESRSKRASRKPLSHSEAKRALKHAKVTTRRIREEGDPQHGSFAPPCRSCTAMLAHFGVRTVGGPDERS